MIVMENKCVLGCCLYIYIFFTNSFAGMKKQWTCGSECDNVRLAPWCRRGLCELSFADCGKCSPWLRLVTHWQWLDSLTSTSLIVQNLTQVDLSKFCCVSVSFTQQRLSWTSLMKTCSLFVFSRERAWGGGGGLTGIRWHVCVVHGIFC